MKWLEFSSLGLFCNSLPSTFRLPCSSILQQVAKEPLSCADAHFVFAGCHGLLDLVFCWISLPQNFFSNFVWWQLWLKNVLHLSDFSFSPAMLCKSIMVDLPFCLSWCNLLFVDSTTSLTLQHDFSNFVWWQSWLNNVEDH